MVSLRWSVWCRDAGGGLYRLQHTHMPKHTQTHTQTHTHAHTHTHTHTHMPLSSGLSRLSAVLLRRAAGVAMATGLWLAGGRVRGITAR